MVQLSHLSTLSCWLWQGKMFELRSQVQSKAFLEGVSQVPVTIYPRKLWVYNLTQIYLNLHFYVLHAPLRHSKFLQSWRSVLFLLDFLLARVSSSSRSEGLEENKEKHYLIRQKSILKNITKDILAQNLGWYSYGRVRILGIDTTFLVLTSSAFDFRLCAKK